MNESFFHGTRPLPEIPVTEVPPPRQEYNVQRRGARVRVRPGAAAKLQFWDVTLRNISRSGVLLEHSQRVQVGELYRLAFQVDGLHLKVTAWAVRSFVSHFVPVPGGEQQIVFRTGMEFTDVTEDTAKRISAYIDRQRASDYGP
jgi:hypothetical protein